MGTAGRHVPSRVVNETPSMRAFRSHQAMSTALIACMTRPLVPRLRHARSHRGPPRGDVLDIGVTDDAGQVVLDDTRRSGGGVRPAEPGRALGMQDDNDGSRGVPGQGSVRLALGGVEATDVDGHVGDGRSHDESSVCCSVSPRRPSRTSRSAARAASAMIVKRGVDRALGRQCRPVDHVEVRHAEDAVCRVDHTVLVPARPSVRRRPGARSGRW